MNLVLQVVEQVTALQGYRMSVEERGPGSCRDKLKVFCAPTLQTELPNGVVPACDMMTEVL